MKRALLAALLSLPALAAKADQGMPMPQAWQVAMVDGTPPGWTATLNLSEPGQVFGQAPCNRYSGPLTQEGRSFRPGKLAATRMACPNLQAEDEFFRLLRGIDTADHRPGLLVLTGGGHEMRLVPLAE